MLSLGNVSIFKLLRLDEITKGLIIAREVKKRRAFIFLGLPPPLNHSFRSLLHNHCESKGLSSLGWAHVLPGELCHNTAPSGPVAPLCTKQSSVSLSAASALAPGTHLLPVPLRFPLPTRQPPPCPGEKIGSHYPAN